LTSGPSIGGEPCLPVTGSSSSTITPWPGLRTASSKPCSSPPSVSNDQTRSIPKPRAMAA
jgi:hypothetical protein